VAVAARVDLGDARQGHDRVRRRGRHRTVRPERVPAQLQPARVQVGRMDEQDAAAAPACREGSVELWRRLGGAVAPQRRLQAAAPGADAQVDGRAGRDRDRGPCFNDLPLFPAVGGEDEPALLGGDACVLVRPGAAQQEARAQRGVGDRERRQLLAVAAVVVEQVHRHGLGCGRAHEPARDGEDGRAARDGHAPVVQRRPLGSPAASRRGRGEVARVAVGGVVQDGLPRASISGEPARGQRRPGDDDGAAGQRLGPGQPARPAHGNGVRRQVYPGASSGRTPPRPAPRPTWR
jgi:hypothetical protein